MIPAPASTVVLLRDAPAGLEVFMVRRHEQLAFMGGAYVFPGGRVDAADRGPRDPDGFRAAALRELFEEGGVLLARDASGRALSFVDASMRTRFQTYRRTVLDKTQAFREVLNREQLHLDLGALVLFAHWVTPPRLSRRFDTSFFAARAPEDQDALHDAGETIESVWIAPGDALTRGDAGSMDLPPPTRHTLEGLSTFARADAALAWYGERAAPRFEPQ
ncbi:MAG TPA: NUDIX domain-containing protein [Vicinamibacterales bacterium]|jgi:8-oxo-dGTP pyrophosphatase MutT (NUDIX family)|nr:NUDIX domain-containing protein [Vicinamibacterales bacterium]